MTTLVVCLDRTDDVGRRTGLQSPIVGWEAVRALVTDIGLADPEDSGVNTLLETLRVAQDLRDDDEEAIVAVVSGDRESMVSADRAVARQLDDLIAEYDPDSAIVVLDSAEDERLVPIVESRVQVDSVDRVVVRQARDIESTYYLMKQFLADEELRQTVLVPLGLTLLVFPFLAMRIGAAEGAAAITTVIGLFLLYKGFNVDEIVTGLGHQVRESLYSGQVSVVTYVVAAGLTFVGLFVGALGVSSLGETQGVVVPAVRFAYDSVPWLAVAALTASAGRLLDEAIGEEPIRSSFLNLPFIVVSVGLVIRGVTAYFLQQQGVIRAVDIPAIELGILSIEQFTVEAGQRLALYVVTAIVVSLVGARVASYFGGTEDDGEPAVTNGGAEPDSEVPDGGPPPTAAATPAPAPDGVPDRDARPAGSADSDVEDAREDGTLVDGSAPVTSDSDRESADERDRTTENERDSRPETDADADTDAETEADSDTDGDTDTDSEPAADP